MTIDEMLHDFENGLRKFIIANATQISFTHPQYTIQKDGEGRYDITLSVSGSGVQFIQLAFVGDEFSMKGKLVETGNRPQFPFQIISQLLNDSIQKWLLQTIDNGPASEHYFPDPKQGGAAPFPDAKEIEPASQTIPVTSSP